MRQVKESSETPLRRRVIDIAIMDTPSRSSDSRFQLCDYVYPYGVSQAVFTRTGIPALAQKRRAC